jgi:ABC-2 type transport system permease protein
MSVRAGAPALPPAREIRGPSAWGGGLRRFLDLTWLTAKTDFRLTYFGSVLGYLWSLMRPLMLFGVLYLVFSQIIKFGAGINYYAVLLLLNIVLFNFFTEATQASVTSVIDREQMVRKMHFPRMVIPLSVVLTGLFNLALNLLAVFVFVVANGVPVRWTWLLLPLVLIPLIALTTGVAMLLSSLYVRFRDVQPIWFVFSTLLFYASPVLYTFEVIDARGFQKLFMLNPIACLLEQARQWVVDSSAPSAVDAVGGPALFLVPVAILVGTCALGVWVFNREAPRIAELL